MYVYMCVRASKAEAAVGEQASGCRHETKRCFILRLCDCMFYYCPFHAFVRLYVLLLPFSRLRFVTRQASE